MPQWTMANGLEERCTELGGLRWLRQLPGCDGFFSSLTALAAWILHTAYGSADMFDSVLLGSRS